jgi:hypothetical protein
MEHSTYTTSYGNKQEVLHVFSWNQDGSRTQMEISEDMWHDLVECYWENHRQELKPVDPREVFTSDEDDNTPGYTPMPLSVQIGEISHAVSTTAEDMTYCEHADQVKNLMGAYNSQRALIAMLPDLTHDTAVDVMWHEVLHAIAANSAMELTKEQEEMVVRAITPFLVAVLRHNSQLLAWSQAHA